MGETCIYCGTELPSGAFICRGCGAELIYGASGREIQDGSRYGAYTGVFIYFALVLKLFSFSFLVLIGTGMVGATFGMGIARYLNRDKVRFFRRMSPY